MKMLAKVLIVLVFAKAALSQDVEIDLPIDQLVVEAIEQLDQVELRSRCQHANAVCDHLKPKETFTQRIYCCEEIDYEECIRTLSDAPCAEEALVMQNLVTATSFICDDYEHWSMECAFVRFPEEIVFCLLVLFALATTGLVILCHMCTFLDRPSKEIFGCRRQIELKVESSSNGAKIGVVLDSVSKA